MINFQKVILFSYILFLFGCFSTKETDQKMNSDSKNNSSWEIIESDADFCLTQDNFDCALYLYNQLLSKFPDSAKYYYKRSLVHQKKNDFEQSLRDISRAIELSDSLNYEYFYTRGLTYYNINEFESAKDDFQTSVQLNNNCGNCYNFLASSLGALFEGQMAIEAYKKSIATNRHKLEYRINLAIEYIKQNAYDSSLIVLNKAIELDTTQYLLFFYRALVLYETENFDSGDTDLLYALQLHKSTLTLCYEQIKQYKLTNGFIIADRMLSRMSDVYPDKVEIYIERAQINQFFKENVIAIQMYSKALESDPDNFDWRISRAKLLMQEHQFSNALTDYSKLIEQHPKKSEFYIKRGYAFYKLNQLPEAKKDWQNALSLGDTKAQEYLRTYIEK
jgi:tetratricopeptide (TPR) repeat protein